MAAQSEVLPERDPRNTLAPLPGGPGRIDPRGAPVWLQRLPHLGVLGIVLPWWLRVGNHSMSLQAISRHARIPALACSLLAALLCLVHPCASAQDLSLNPTRPTVANSAAIQSQGVLQVETGYDGYPQRVPGNQQTVDTFITYTPLPRLRLDFDWPFFNHQPLDASSSVNGVGDIQLGGKVEFKKEDYHRLPPGIALQYEAEFATAPNPNLRNLGQQAILLVNHHYGPNGDLDVMLNASIVQSGCQAGSRCSYGGQQSLAFSYHVTEKTRLYAEAFAQNVTQSNTPPGTYVFGGFYHPFNDSFGIDGGMRFGVSDHSASVGTTIGLVFGKRLHGQADAKPVTH